MGLHPTTLHVRSGEHFVLLGPSGSGKTTLLRLVAGLETPDGGTITFDDRPVHGLPPHQREISFVAQGTALYPDRDVRGNIASGLAFGPRASRPSAVEIESRVREAADLLHIDRYLSARPHELSGGEQRRVVLARAVVRRASDLAARRASESARFGPRGKIIQDLHLLQRQFGLTIVHVTHDPNEAMATGRPRRDARWGAYTSDRNPGRSLYARPSSRTVGLHFGRPPINLIDGRADGTPLFPPAVGSGCPVHTRGPVTLGIRPEDVGFGRGDGFIRVGDGTCGGRSTGMTVDSWSRWAARTNRSAA